MLKVTPVLRTEREQLLKMVDDYWRTFVAGHRLADDSLARDKRFEEEFWAQRDSRFLWWATVDENRVGFAKTDLLEDVMWGTQGDIGDFYIAPSFRRQGHGAAFARLLLDWFSQRSVKSVRLYVRLDNPGALAFWEKEGFETVQVWHQMRRMAR